MKIVILDGYAENPGDLSWDFLKNYGEIEIYDRTPADKILERASGAGIVVTNKTPLTKDTLSRLPDLKFVALLSTGYNIADCDYLAERHIPVSNIPSYSTEGVAQLVMAFILEFAQGVGLHSDSVHSGEWSACPDFCYTKKNIFELSGKTLGIFGFGRIGRAVAKRADAFGMNVIAYTPRMHGDEPDYVSFVDIDTLRAGADFITFHCPLTTETDGIVDSGFIAGMKDGAYIINTSRGPVLNEKDVADALDSGKLAGVGVDVLSVEPPAPDNPMLHAKNCLITPHIAWAAFETRVRLMEIFKGNIEAFLSGKPRNVVNGSDF
ncbi:MAG: D-2-hydroxyacid dehydrogenase [Clostridia bacterium]|nr:D-2-hydroxyacid dehydrogenase [Clostridia bacterium]